MFGQLLFKTSGETALYLYRTKADFQRDAESYMLAIPLTNEQVTELVCLQKMKPLNWDDL